MLSIMTYGDCWGVYTVYSVVILRCSDFLMVLLELLYI